MKSIKFKEVTNTIAENQPEYTTVHSQWQPGEQSVNMCFELTDEDIEVLKKEKKIWYKQLIGSGKMHPMRLSVSKSEMINDKLVNLNTETREGKLLLAALSILTVDNFSDKNPVKVIEILEARAKEMKI